MKDRWGLIQRGLFPETLPPCFTSIDLKRAFHGLIGTLKERELHQKRHADYVRYNGTKHDGSRRYFGTPNPIPYFYVADFIAQNWSIFEGRYRDSPFTVSHPKIGKDTDDRAVIISSLSELTTVASQKLGHAAFILKTDIAQFFPSIYTHSIPWAAYGIENAKADQAVDSQHNTFNRLNFFVRNCQNAETRGVLVGPDAFRLISEFVASTIDQEFSRQYGDHIIGAARHVDDYYIGVAGQPEALAALSVLRDHLQRFSLNLNDTKTRTMEGVEPLNDVWAQELRKESKSLRTPFSPDEDDVVLLLNKALELAKELHSDSPVKIALRTFDQLKLYGRGHWHIIEPYLQRLIFHHPHCIDYVALLTIKRVALDRSIDREGWQAACYSLIEHHLRLNHHHEIVWLLWLLISAKIELSDELVAALSANENAHIRAMLVCAYTYGRIGKRPPISLGAKLATTDHDWLLTLAAKAQGYTGASFSGALAGEFEHLAKRKVRLIDFDAHMEAMQVKAAEAISRTRYGYDSELEDDPEYGPDGDDWDDDNDPW